MKQLQANFNPCMDIDNDFRDYAENNFSIEKIEAERQGNILEADLDCPFERIKAAVRRIRNLPF